MRDMVVFSGTRLQCNYPMKTVATWLALSVAPLFETTSFRV